MHEGGGNGSAWGMVALDQDVGVLVEVILLLKRFGSTMSLDRMTF